jgi:hypothetical protein
MPQSRTGGRLAEPTGSCVVPIQDFVVDKNAERGEDDHDSNGRNLTIFHGRSLRLTTIPLPQGSIRRKM